MVQTEFEFTLPCGYLDSEGTLHREGVMRRATAADEILPLKDARVVKNPAYLVVILLPRVVTRLGSISEVNPKVVEEVYATDLAYLQELYNQINSLREAAAAARPQARHDGVPEPGAAGRAGATPRNAPAEPMRL